jgi:beta-fructofuranosidase
MALRLLDRWIWDFWLVRHGGQHHLFFLQAPRALGTPNLRHHSASVGHAVSTDLATWRLLPDALHPGPEGCWDDLAIWTGSAIGHAGRWYMLYTGISRSEHGLIQRIGLAVSDDLVRWEKHRSNPVLELDPTWYELLDRDRWRDQSWRDPWLFHHAGDGHLHALITARSHSGPADGAGVVAHARSRDLVAWEVLPPLTTPGDFAQVEVPQLVHLDGRYQILVSCRAEDHSQQRRQRLENDGQTGTFAYSAHHPFGPYTAADEPLAAPDGPLGTLYAGKLIEGESGYWSFMAVRGDGDREFLGELTDPLPVRRHKEGGIAVSCRPAKLLEDSS